MKKTITLLILLASLAFAHAQQANMLMLQLATPARLTQTSNTVYTNTTTAIDVHGFQGPAMFTLTVISNSTDAAASLATTFQGSMDGTNYWTLSNACPTTATTVGITNWTASGTNSFGVVNTYYKPGTDYTYNITNTTSACALKEWRVVASQLPRYVRMVNLLSGSNAVYSVGATFRALRGQPY